MGEENTSKDKDIRPNRNRNGLKIRTGDELQVMRRNVNILTRIQARRLEQVGPSYRVKKVNLLATYDSMKSSRACSTHGRNEMCVQ